MPKVRMKPTAAEAMQWRAFGIEVVGAEARPHQLGGGIALEDGPLTRAEHADGLRTLLLQDALPLARHLVEGLVPGDGLNSASLSNFPSRTRISGVGEPVRAIHDLRQEVALHAVEAAVDLRLHVAVGRHDTAVLDADHHAAAGAAEPARRLRPFQLDVLAGREVLRLGWQVDAGDRGGGRGGLGLEEGAAGHVHGRLLGGAACRRDAFEVVVDERRREDARQLADLAEP